MKKYLYDYIASIDKLINSKASVTKKIVEEHLTKIQFFQHERLIHLLVTLFYWVFMLIFMGLGTIFIGFFLIGLILLIFVFNYYKIFMVILLIFVLCYVIHYFRLENGVQYLYKQYDKLQQRIKN